MIVAMLTTVDNPFSPFDEYDEWYAFDERKGYHTPSYLARVVGSGTDLSDVDENFFITKAIDEIVDLNPLGLYKKVTREIKSSQEE